MSRHFAVILLLLTPNAFGGEIAGPLAAHVEITVLKSYGASSALVRPHKILVRDFEFNPDIVQVDKIQEVRPRHLISGSEKPEHIGREAAKNVSKELIKELSKTGIPVQPMIASTPPCDDCLIVSGSFLALKQGVKTERVVVGMGAGSAEVRTRVQLELQTPKGPIAISEFETSTTTAKNIGAGVTTAAGLNPAVAATRSTVSDRKKTVNAYASKTGEAAAKQITSAMAGVGWVKVDNKGKLVQ